jgi:plasmid stabilization system protein ParE
MGWQVVFSIRSRDDLRRIVQFIAREDPAAAERFGLGLIAQVESLASAPHIGMPVPERPGTRFFPFGSYSSSTARTRGSRWSKSSGFGMAPAGRGRCGEQHCQTASAATPSRFCTPSWRGTKTSELVSRARELQQDAEAERMIEMADAATVEDWQVVRLRIWARMWRASKLAPRKYGAKPVEERPAAQVGCATIDLAKIRSLRGGFQDPPKLEAEARLCFWRLKRSWMGRML